MNEKIEKLKRMVEDSLTEGMVIDRTEKATFFTSLEWKKGYNVGYHACLKWIQNILRGM